MANLYLTHRCKRGCPFCFARKVLKESGENVNELLSIDDIRLFLDRFGSEVKVIGLLGGEPFLYPHMRELLALLDERGVFAKIFTSATDPMPEILSEKYSQDVAGKCCFVVNVGTRDTYSDEKYAHLQEFFKHYNEVSSLSFTIFDLNADPTYLFDLIDEYNLVRNIRVGIALPILNGGNEYIPLDKYKEAGDYFVHAADMAAQRHITLSMDCGFVACMFDATQIGHLQRLGGEINFVCGSAIDIGPRLLAWNCFPLFQIGRVNTMDAANMRQLKEMLHDSTTQYLGAARGVFAECDNCKMMERGLCQGGCKSFKSV